MDRATKSEKNEIEDKAAESFSEEANQSYKDIIKSAIELDAFALTLVSVAISLSVI